MYQRQKQIYSTYYKVPANVWWKKNVLPLTWRSRPLRKVKTSAHAGPMLRINCPFTTPLSPLRRPRCQLDIHPSSPSRQKHVPRETKLLLSPLIHPQILRSYVVFCCSSFCILSHRPIVLAGLQAVPGFTPVRLGPRSTPMLTLSSE